MKKSYVKELKAKPWEDCIDKAYKKVSKDIKVDGFRKGLVPKDIYIKKYGVESLFQDALDYALPIMFESLLEDKDTIKPACTPTINIKNIDKSRVEVEFIIVGIPEIKLGKYKNLSVKEETINITDDEINHEIDHMKEQFAELKAVDGKIKKGHIAIIDFEGFKDDVPFEGGKAENHSLTIGSNSFIPGFEEALIGLKQGDEKDVNLTFPENYHAQDLKGKDVVFKVKINEVKERILPSLNEEFFKDLAMEGINSEKELKAEIKKNLKFSKERAAEEKKILDSLELVIKNAKFEIPEEMLQDETERVYDEFAERLALQGMDIENYLAITNTSKESLLSQMKPDAQKRVEYRLIVDAVAVKENIVITKEDLNKEIKKMVKKYGVTKEELLKNVGDEKAIEYDMRMKAALEIITGIKKEE